MAADAAAQRGNPGQSGGHLSLWAAGSLIASALLCPPLCVIGPAMGIGALADIRRNGRTGAWLAWSGIVLGLTLTIVWLLLAAWWQVNVRRPMLDGPELAAGLAGDVAGFRGQFLEPPGATDLEAAAFLRAVADRYGDVHAIRQGPPGEPATVEDINPSGIAIPYMVQFDAGEVPIEAQFVITKGGRVPMILKWRWLRVIDAERGDLIYPAAVPVPAPLSPAADEESP